MLHQEILIFSNGERFPILIDDNGQPHLYITLWTVVRLRNKYSFNTILNKLNHVRKLVCWEDEKNVNLYLNFQNGSVLSWEQLEDIKDYMSRRMSCQHKPKRNKVIYLNGRALNISPALSVGNKFLYDRLSVIAEYFDFLSRVALKNNASEYVKIQEMIKYIKKMRPKDKSNKTVSIREDVTKELINSFMEVICFDNVRNPFKNINVRKRNYLMFHLLNDYGIRSGELLSMKIEKMVTHGSDKCFWVTRTHDDVSDCRRRQPVAKTKERRIPIKALTAKLINEYIEIRSDFSNAQYHSYLFVTHKSGKHQGNPISKSTLDSILKKVIDKYPDFKGIYLHFFRHLWNENFSEKIDKHNELSRSGISGFDYISPETEIKIRAHLLGHSSESSSAVYNKRHIARKANKVVLEEQELLQEKLKKTKGDMKNER